MKRFFILLATATILYGCPPPPCTYETDQDCFCEKNPTDERCPDVNCKGPTVSIQVSSPSVTVEVSKTVTVTAIPKAAEGCITADKITWDTQSSAIAIVVNGVITGVKAGQTTVVAICGAVTATVNVTVTDPIPVIDHVSLKGSNYYVVSLSTAARAMIAGKIISDFAPNGDSGTEPGAKRLWVWESTLAGLPTSGSNSYGVAEGWMKFQQLLGWSGAAYCCYDKDLINSLKAVSDDYQNYYLHIAYRSMRPSENTSFRLMYPDGGDPSPDVIIGDVPRNGKDPYPTCTKGAKGTAITSFAPDGEWYHFDIPMSYFVAQGWIYKGNFVQTVTTDPVSGKVSSNGQNIFGFGASGKDAMIEYDAVFIYKKQ